MEMGVLFKKHFHIAYYSNLKINRDCATIQILDVSFFTIIYV